MAKVHGVGINDSKRVLQKMTRVDGKVTVLWIDPIYTLWSNMLARGYSSVWKNKHPSYRDTKVCDDWFLFSTFESWVIKNGPKDLSGYDLDKDLLSCGLEFYSPETCVFLPRWLNRSLSLTGGVSERGGRFVTQVQDGERRSYKRFNTFSDAHIFWQNGKLRFFKNLALRYSKEEFFDQRVFDALNKIVDKITCDIDNGVSTTCFYQPNRG